MNKNLTVTRLVGLLAALGAGVTAFTGDVTAVGGYKAAAVAAFSAIVATWLHEEHATERNNTTAAASITPAPSVPVPTPEHVAAMMGQMMRSTDVPPGAPSIPGTPSAAGGAAPVGSAMPTP